MDLAFKTGAPLSTNSLGSIGRLESVEALRGIAAMAVAWFHFSNGTGLLADGWLKASGSYGWLGVELFFVISGFIIPYSMQRAGFHFPGDCGRFLMKRVVRLEPTYLVAVLLALALLLFSAATPGFRGTPPDISLVAVLLHLGYLNDFAGVSWLNPVFWSLAIEFQFYLLVAFIFPFLGHRSGSVRLLFLAVFCALTYVLPGSSLVFHYAGLFALGILTFQKATGLIATREYLLASAVVAVATTPTLGLPIVVTGCITALIIAFIEFPKLLPLAFLGAVSYSMYLLHVPIGGRVVNFGARYADGLLLQILVLAAAFVTSLAAAYALHRWIETPSRSWSSSIRYRGNSKTQRPQS